MKKSTLHVLEQAIESERYLAQDAEREWCRRLVEHALNTGANPLDAITRPVFTFDRETLAELAKGLER